MSREDKCSFRSSKSKAASETGAYNPSWLATRQAAWGDLRHSLQGRAGQQTPEPRRSSAVTELPGTKLEQSGTLYLGLLLFSARAKPLTSACSLCSWTNLGFSKSWTWTQLGKRFPAPSVQCQYCSPPRATSQCSLNSVRSEVQHGSVLASPKHPEMP